VTLILWYVGTFWQPLRFAYYRVRRVANLTGPPTKYSFTPYYGDSLCLLPTLRLKCWLEQSHFLKKFRNRGPVRRILEQTLWLIETGKINKDQMRHFKKEERWKVLCNQMWTRCRLGRTSALSGVITLMMVVAETFRTKRGIHVISVFASLAVMIDCLFHTVRIPAANRPT